MFEGLSDELEARGIVAGPYGDLLDFEWCQDVESEKWVLSTAVRIVESYDEDKNVALSIDPHSILCLARAVEYIPISIEVPILVDLCVVARAVCVVKGVPAPIMFHVEMLLAQGRYFDLLQFYENKMEEGVYDRTFAEDLSELIQSLDSWNKECQRRREVNSDEMEGADWARREKICQRNMMRFCRGGLMQIERGLKVMSYDDIKQSMDLMIDVIIVVGLSYNHSTERGQMTDPMYTDSMSFDAYSYLMLNNLAGGEVPAEKILETAAKSCMDDYFDRGGIEKDSILHYGTLFGHIMRLRLLSSSRDGVAWENAVTRAREAVGGCMRNRGWRTYESVITSLIETGRLGDMEEYASVLSRSD